MDNFNPIAEMLLKAIMDKPPENFTKAMDKALDLQAKHLVELMETADTFQLNRIAFIRTVMQKIYARVMDEAFPDFLKSL